MSAHLKSQGFARTQRRAVDGGGHTITMMRISCRSCTNFLEKRRSQENQAPLPLEKCFKREGWWLDFRKPGSVICPKCQKVPKPPVVAPAPDPMTNVFPITQPKPVKEIVVADATNYKPPAPEVRKRRVMP